MAIVLGPNRYGKAEVRLVRVVRDGDVHGLADLNVSVALEGDLEATHVTGDNSGVLPTDTMKNTVYAFAKEHGVGAPEDFALLLARHFVSTQPQITGATVRIEAYGWERLGPHSFRRRGDHTRTAEVIVTAEQTRTTAGLTGLTLLNTTDSEFHGFTRDRYTTLPETTDRILATEVDATWRYGADAGDFDAMHEAVQQALLDAFVHTYSHSLQQTLFAMGRAVLEACAEVEEIRLVLPNKHHYPVDLSPFGGLNNPGEVFVAGDRPYGLIEGTVTRS